MLSMDRDQTHGTFAPRKPRTSLRHKPRLGSHLFLELDKTIRSSYTHASHVNDKLRDEGVSHGSSHDYRAYNDASKADDGRAFKSSYKRVKRRELHDSDYENAYTREGSHESSDNFDASRKPIMQNATAPKCHHPVHTEDLNQVIVDGHIDKVGYKPGLSNRTQSKRGHAASRLFDDDDIKKETCLGQGDDGVAAGGQHPYRNVCAKNDMDHVPRAKLGTDTNASSQKKLDPKRGQNKTLGKKSPSFKVDGITHHSDKGAHLIPEMKKKKAFYETVSPLRKSPCAPEARRRRRYTSAQEAFDNVDMPKCRDESLGEDAISGADVQSSPEVELNTHGNRGSGSRRVADANDGEGLQVPTLRKSSRVPKKRILDGDEGEPLRRLRKKLEIEPAVEFGVNAEQDKARDMAVGDDQLLSECPDKECHKSDETSGPDSDEKKELSLTARQRALRFSKEGGDPELGTNMEFPDGLQPVLPKKQKENLTEAEQAIKKEEAAKRRKQQMERNANEIQTIAIQKILGQESSRKKREEKLRKQRQEIEQEKQAASMAPAVNSIRWVMGPSGNVVSFSQDVELPKIFSGPCSYPQEREKCAGPSCNNAYKYRDSKTRLPLCSLQCYRAVQELPSSAPAF